jgi:rhodanese-related sulfurtransferase
MSNSKYYPILLCFLAFMGTACAQSTEKFEDMLRDMYKNSVPLAKSADLQQEKNVIYLDTRETEEYNVSHLPNAICIGYKQPNWTFIYLLSRDANIVVYCSVGYRSERIGEQLRQNGFKNVRNLYGGIFDWFNQGYPTIDNNKQTTLNIHTYNKKWSRWVTRGNKIY